MEAIVQIGPSQYQVMPGSLINIPLVKNQGPQLVFTNILLVTNNGNTIIGQPFIKGAQIKATIKDQVRGEKIRITKYKGKSRYDKTVGFRSKYTRISIDEIILPSSISPNRITKKTRETKS